LTVISKMYIKQSKRECKAALHKSLASIMPVSHDSITHARVIVILTLLLNHNIISSCRIMMLEPEQKICADNKFV